jgi:hypothetical protein
MPFAGDLGEQLLNQIRKDEPALRSGLPADDEPEKTNSESSEDPRSKSAAIHQVRLA